MGSDPFPSVLAVLADNPDLAFEVLEREPELNIPGTLMFRADVQHLENIPLAAQQPHVLSRDCIALMISGHDTGKDGYGLIGTGRKPDPDHLIDTAGVENQESVQRIGPVSARHEPVRGLAHGDVAHAHRPDGPSHAQHAHGAKKYCNHKLFHTAKVAKMTYWGQTPFRRFGNQGQTRFTRRQ